MNNFNPDLFRLFRAERGLSQKTLAEKLGVVQSEISKAESGKKIPSDWVVEKASALFGCLPSFFGQTDVLLPEEGIRHRKRKALSATLRERIEAQALLRMMDVAAFSKCCGENPSTLPSRNGKSSVEMARALRAAWRVPSGPVENLIGILEQHGVLILSFDFGTDLLDAFAIPQPDSAAPVCIALNTNPCFPADRQRFTLAHELGHIVLHREEFADESDEKRQEKEANEFAGEFLAPRTDVESDLTPPLTFPRLRELKAKWKMSMGALVHRAEDIGILKPSEAKRIWFFFGRYGYRKREPTAGIVRETPQGVQKLLAGFLERHGQQAPSVLHLTQGLFEKRYPGATAGNFTRRCAL